MTERRFYIWISFLPLAVPLVAGAVAVPSLNADAAPPTGITKVASFVFLTGIFSTIPYAIILAGLFWRLRAAARINLRRLVWTLPLWISLGFAPVFAFVSGSSVGPRGFAEAMLVGGLWALVVGYSYATLIELLRFIGTRIRWIREPAEDVASAGTGS